MPIIFADGECIKKVGMRSNIMRKIIMRNNTRRSKF